jgi:hypothetical protein
VTDWVTISSLATAGGTLVLAVATFASVRSANRAARVAEETLRTSVRPLLMPSRLSDPPVKVGFADGRWIHTPGGGGMAEATDEAIYLTISVRNAGQGIAVMHGWRFEPDVNLGTAQRPDPASFRRLSRDIYVPVGEVGFWQGAVRDRVDDQWAGIRDRIAARERLIIDVLYGDHEGGQRVISRFSLVPRDDGTWLASVARHWNVDRPDPR